jgi:hypothetical protein
VYMMLVDFLVLYVMILYYIIITLSLLSSLIVTPRSDFCQHGMHDTSYDTLIMTSLMVIASFSRTTLMARRRRGVIRPFCITILYHNLLLFIDIFHI